MDFQLVDRVPTVEEYQSLRESVGWKVSSDEIAQRGLDGSVAAICAVVDGETVGIARLTGDGGMYVFVSDVIVRPTHQRNGIATAMMKRITQIARDLDVASIGLFAADHIVPLYERVGYYVDSSRYMRTTAQTEDEDQISKNS